MIKKLRIKFIVLSMAALFVLLAVVVAGMNLINYRSVIRDAEETLNYMAKHKGTFPEMMKPDDEGFPKEEGMPGGGGKFDGQEFPNGMSPETPYESRFFSVLLSEDGTVIMTDVRRIMSVSEEQAAAYAAQVQETSREQGFVDDYLFIKSTDEDGIRITFLDCGRKLASARKFLLISLIVAAAGYILFFFVIFFFSKRMIKPVAESYEKQKRFITDAGHEIKTPLAIIKADADVLEMEYENNEWVEDIQKQTRRLTSLTNDLVSLARMEEAKDLSSWTEIALSDVVREEAEAYLMMAEAQKKDLEIAIQPDLSMKGNEKQICRLVNILLDNALKYSPEETAIRLSLKKTGKQIALAVYNKTENEISKENLKLMFDRFYRMDSSRNSETGGHGIGLSMAKAITESHGGKIAALSEDGHSLEVNVSFPV